MTNLSHGKDCNFCASGIGMTIKWIIIWSFIILGLVALFAPKYIIPAAIILPGTPP